MPERILLVFFFLIFTFNLSVCFFLSFFLLLLSGEFLLPNTCVFDFCICVLHTLNFIFCMRPYVCNFIHMIIYKIVYIALCVYMHTFVLFTLTLLFNLARSCSHARYLCAIVYRFLVIIIQETSRFLCCIGNY